MSYAINATQAKWFGFQPKYVWDDFMIEHSTVARKIKSRTFPIFMEIDECEARIKEEARNILKSEEINVVTFTARSKRMREEERRMTTRQILRRNDEMNMEEGEGKRN